MLKRKAQEFTVEDLQTKKVHKEEERGSQKTEKGESPQKPAAPSLFNTTLPTTEKTPSLFGNLFGGVAPPTQSSLFGGSLFTNNATADSTDKPKTGFFQNLSSTSNPLNFQSLFNNNKPETEAKPENESEDEKLPESPEIDPTKSSANYQYEEKYNKVISSNVLKCKINDQEAYEQGQISIEENKESKVNTLFYRTTLKRILFQGQLIAKLLGNKALGKSEDAVQVNAFSSDKSEKLQKSVIKIKKLVKYKHFVQQLLTKIDCLQTHIIGLNQQKEKIEQDMQKQNDQIIEQQAFIQRLQNQLIEKHNTQLGLQQRVSMQESALKEKQKSLNQKEAKAQIVQKSNRLLTQQLESKNRSIQKELNYLFMRSLTTDLVDSVLKKEITSQPSLKQINFQELQKIINNKTKGQKNCFAHGARQSQDRQAQPPENQFFTTINFNQVINNKEEPHNEAYHKKALDQLKKVSLKSTHSVQEHAKPKIKIVTTQHSTEKERLLHNITSCKNFSTSKKLSIIKSQNDNFLKNSFTNKTLKDKNQISKTFKGVLPKNLPEPTPQSQAPSFKQESKDELNITISKD